MALVMVLGVAPQRGGGGGEDFNEVFVCNSTTRRLDSLNEK